MPATQGRAKGHPDTNQPAPRSGSNASDRIEFAAETRRKAVGTSHATLTGRQNRHRISAGRQIGSAFT